MKIGTIDIGTNSMRLLIADYVGNQIENRRKYVNTTRIGKGVNENGYIIEEAMERNLIALKEFVDMCKAEGCESIYAMGTSALRDSKNGDEFVRRGKELTGVEVKIIGGIEESDLGFKGGCSNNSIYPLIQDKSKNQISTTLFIRWSIFCLIPILEQDIYNKKKTLHNEESFLYPERDLNPHNRNDRRILSPVCLPFHHPGILERKTGLEPATPTLARLCSTN